MPSKAVSIAQLQHQLLTAQPYHFTSDDLLFEVHAIRHAVAPEDRGQARTAFFSKPQACLRASPLVKQFGWGLHHDAESKVAAYDVATEAYRELITRKNLKIVAGMRNHRAAGLPRQGEPSGREGTDSCPAGDSSTPRPG